MTQEEKELLLKDLCARLPYGIIAHALEIDKIGTVTDINVSYNTINLTVDNASGKYELVPMSDIKPYLRPMSSMTKEEVQEINKHGWNLYRRRDEAWVVSEDKYNESDTGDKRVPLVGEAEATWLLDYFNSHHFDYRSLIEKGLALEAPADMYKTE